MDGAGAAGLDTPIARRMQAAMSRRAWRGSDAGAGVSRAETPASADLGGSSKYSNENFED